MPETEHERWQLSQLQYYVQTLLDLSNEDNKTLDSKIEHYHSNVTGFRDKILGGIGVLITILLASIYTRERANSSFNSSGYLDHHENSLIADSQ